MSFSRFEWRINYVGFSRSGGELVGTIGYGRWIAVRTSHLVMQIWCDDNDGLVIVFDVYNMIILINGTI